MIKRPWFFQKILFSNWCHGHVKCNFDSLAKFFWQKAEKSYLNVQNCWKKWKVFPGFFLPLNVRIETGWSCGTSVDFFLTKSWSFFAECTNMFRKLKIFQTEFFASKCSEGHVTFSFDSANEVFWQRFKIFNSISKNVKKISISFRKMFFIKMLLCNHLNSFGNPARTFPTKSQFFLDQRPNMKWKTKFSKRSKLFRGTGSLRIWQHRRNFFQKKQKSFSSKSENVKEVYIFQLKFSFPSTFLMNI